MISDDRILDNKINVEDIIKNELISKKKLIKKITKLAQELRHTRKNSDKFLKVLIHFKMITK